LFAIGTADAILRLPRLRLGDLKLEKTHMNTLFLKMLVKAQDLMNREEGQDLVEYALLVALIALVAVTGVKQVASAVNTVFSSISTTLA
jgi:pilus assembly protein Flp/PilA